VLDDTATPSVAPPAFRQILGAFPTGVTVITATDARGVNVGLCANAVSSVSIDPPLLLVCLSRSTYTLTAIAERGAFAVNFLAAGQEDVARRFASRTPDKFKDLPHSAGTAGVPVLDGCSAVAECAVHELVEAGDHVIVVGHVVAGVVADGQPLMYFRQQFGPCQIARA
jgi:flavin reductase (DIM6/NTAB) family NADH-FMN oxidoreductase RutF